MVSRKDEVEIENSRLDFSEKFPDMAVENDRRDRPRDTVHNARTDWDGFGDPNLGCAG